MILPTHFYLKRKRWVVDLVDRVDGDEEGKLRGICCFNTRRIEIEDSLSDRLLLETFIHEYLHAVEFEYGLKIAHRVIYKLERPLARMVFMLVQIR